MTEWYESRAATDALSQGDLVFSCPVVGWARDAVAPIGDAAGALTVLRQDYVADVVVITQACDLQHDHVSEVVVCEHISVCDFYGLWKEKSIASGQSPTEKAWQRHLDNIRRGFIWNHVLLNTQNSDGVQIEHRIVDFSLVRSLPLTFLRSFVAIASCRRVLLKPPYREHLSQSFARYFMRVGLPTSVSQVPSQQPPTAVPPNANPSAPPPA